MRQDRGSTGFLSSSICHPDLAPAHNAKTTTQYLAIHNVTKFDRTENLSDSLFQSNPNFGIVDCSFLTLMSPEIFCFILLIQISVLSFQINFSFMCETSAV